MKISSHSKAMLSATLLLLLVAAAMIWFEDRVSVNSPGLALPDGSLTEAQKQSLATLLDLVKLLMNWAVGVIGATAFFLKLGVEKDVPIRTTDLILSFTIILVAVISLFLGHLVLDRSAVVLALDQFPVNNRQIRHLARWQYLAGLGCIGLFGLHVFQFFWAKKT